MCICCCVYSPCLSNLCEKWSVTPNVVVTTTRTTSTKTATSQPTDSACGTADPDNDDDDDDYMEDMFVDPHVSFQHAGKEWGGPTRGGRLPEPTRFGDWERKGRCSDF